MCWVRTTEVATDKNLTGFGQLPLPVIFEIGMPIAQRANDIEVASCHISHGNERPKRNGRGVITLKEELEKPVVLSCIL